jgi:metal-sulfur cluster biosynthetic enzyme
LPQNEEQHVTPEQVLEVLQTCYDPCCKERGVSVVELGLIQDVKVAENGHDVRVELLLTSGWCPFSTHLLQMIDPDVAATDNRLVIIHADDPHHRLPTILQRLKNTTKDILEFLAEVGRWFPGSAPLL